MTEEGYNATSPRAGVPPEPRWLFYVLSFVIPLLGIILGIIYLKKPEADAKTFGKTCLILGLVAGAPIVLLCVCWIISAFFTGGMSVIGGLLSLLSS